MVMKKITFEYENDEGKILKLEVTDFKKIYFITNTLVKDSETFYSYLDSLGWNKKK